MKKEKILIFNISTDSNNTSLGFASKLAKSII